MTRDQFYATSGKWERREKPADPECTEWLYDVTLKVTVGLTCPPDHPEILNSLWQNALDRLYLQKDDDPDLIDSFELIEVSEAADA